MSETVTMTLPADVARQTALDILREHYFEDGERPHAMDLGDLLDELGVDDAVIIEAAEVAVRSADDRPPCGEPGCCPDNPAPKDCRPAAPAGTPFTFSPAQSVQADAPAGATTSHGDHRLDVLAAYCRIKAENSRVAGNSASADTASRFYGQADAYTDAAEFARNVPR